MSINLQCDMRADCARPVAMIGNKGYLYCCECGRNRRASGHERTRKLKPAETARLLRGEALARY